MCLMKRTIKALSLVALFAIVAIGLYFVPRLLLASAGQTHAQYVSHSQLVHKLAGNVHSPATHGGSFIGSADISTRDVVSANQRELG